MVKEARLTSVSPKEQLERLRRGVQEITLEEDLLRKLERSYRTGTPLRVKFGVDPTSPDIHLGHTVVLRKLRQFQELGHKAVLIIGDYTALVGDPSGANKTRPILTEEQVNANAQTYLDQVDRILDIPQTEIVRNGDWFRTLTFKQVIELAAKSTVARMMERDDFAKRWAAHQPISVHELLYPLMQGYDSIMVRSDVELGGTDQTFNLLMGRQLQKDCGQEPQATVTMPILVGLDGVDKMSKSKGNYIGVSEQPKDMYGKVMSINDALMQNYFELLTDMPDSEYRELLAGNPRDAKAALGSKIVAAFYGDKAGQDAAEEFNRVFSRRELPSEMPEIVISRAKLAGGRIWVIDLISTAGFASSNSEARRLVAQGAVTLDDARIDDAAAQVELKGGEVLKVGKRRFGKIAIQQDR
jgi:tyrosyl-tRNA synthetase